MHRPLSKFQYPVARREEFLRDNYHGTVVHDPYRWLENFESAETQDFVAAQNALTSGYLETCALRPRIQALLKQLWDFPTYSCPSKKGSTYFFFRNTQLRAHAAIYSQENLEAQPILFLDMGSLTEDGKYVVEFTTRSPDGRVFVYGLSEPGADLITVRFLSTESGLELEADQLERVQFSTVSWTPDSGGLFYSWYPGRRPDWPKARAYQNHKVYYHRMGTRQAEDVLVAELPEEPSSMIGAEVSDCGGYLVLTVVEEGQGQENLCYFAEIQAGLRSGFQRPPELIPVIDEYVAEYIYITNDGPLVYFLTNDKAPNVRLICVNIKARKRGSWRTIIPEHKKNVIQWVAPINHDLLFVCYVEDVKSLLHLHRLADGAFLQNFPLSTGTIIGYSGERSSPEFFFQFQTFFSPGEVYHIDFRAGARPSGPCPCPCTRLKPRLLPAVTVKAGIEMEPKHYRSAQVFFRSTDGTRVPMFILHKKTFRRTGTAPCFLYTNGGLGTVSEPFFQIIRLVMIHNMEAVVGIVNVRGGGEYGQKWHEDGRLLKKQNSFDDFIAAAEYLVGRKYTSPRRIIINGGPHGGLLVGACVNQRPDLFGVAFPEIGLLDMLRFHLFTIGYAWAGDYGRSEDKEQFEVLVRYSPLHNIGLPPDGRTQYPAVLCLATNYDDLVVPAHSLKYIAQLQYKIGHSRVQTNPLMIQIDPRGTDSQKEKAILQYTDRLAFVILTLDLDFHL